MVWEVVRERLLAQADGRARPRRRSPRRRPRGPSVPRRRRGSRAPARTCDAGARIRARLSLTGMSVSDRLRRQRPPRVRRGDAEARKPHDSVTVDIDAPPERVYDLVADIGRMGEWSPECVRCSLDQGRDRRRGRRAVQGQEQGRSRAGLVQHAGRHRRRTRSGVRVQPQRTRHRLLHLAIPPRAHADRHPPHRVVRRRAAARVGHELADDEVDRQRRSRRRPAPGHDPTLARSRRRPRCRPRPRTPAPVADEWPITYAVSRRDRPGRRSRRPRPRRR